MPDNLIRFNLVDFPYEQAIGAIKARANEAGANFRPQSTASKARKLATDLEFDEERKRLYGSEEVSQ